MSDKILEDTKKVLGIAPDYTVFDTDILMHIGSVFSTLDQLGMGPDDGFVVDSSTQWADFIDDDTKFNAIKTYVYLRVRLLFDPPATSFHIAAIQEQIKELEWRLNVTREFRDWTPEIEHDHGLVIDGGEV